MHILDRRWPCWEISHNDQYIATIGAGISIWDRATLEFVHHFTGIRWIHGGIFVNDDVLMVFTGEQKLFFFQISKKKLLWTVSRPRELAASGDMCCCHIPGTEKVCCIAQGKKSLDEHFVLIVDWSSQKILIHQILNCYRVVSNLVWSQELGLSFLSRQAKGNNKTMLYRIIKVDDVGNALILYDEESDLSFLAYSGRYLFFADYNGQIPEAKAYPLEQPTIIDNLTLGEPLRIPITPLLTSSSVGTKRLVFPHVCCVDECTGLLVVCNKQKWVGVYDFINGKAIMELQDGEVNCGKLLDTRLLIGYSSGFSVEPLKT